MTVDPEGDAVNTSGDIKSLSAIVDGRYLHLKVEVYDKKITPQIFSIDLKTDNSGEYAIRGIGKSKAVLINQLFKQEQYTIESSYDKVLEIKVPLQYIGNPEIIQIGVYTGPAPPNHIDIIEPFWNTLNKLSSLSISVSPTEVIMGNAITVLGSLSPPHNDVSIILNYKMPNGTILTRNVTSTVLGEFKDVFTPNIVGVWSVRASWKGDLDHEGAESSNVSFIVLKAKSCLSLSVSRENLTRGEEVTISGFISPPFAHITVMLTFEGPNGKTFTKTVLTDIKGSFNYTFVPEDVGRWNVHASWPGNESYKGSLSPSLSFTVKPKPAEFLVSELSISPVEAKPNQTIMISVKVRNVGEEKGSYTVYLKVAGTVISEKIVTLAGGEYKTVVFELVKEEAGVYDVEVAGLKDAFIVKEAPAPTPWKPYAAVAVITIVVIGIATMIWRKRLMDL